MLITISWCIEIHSNYYDKEDNQIECRMILTLSDEASSSLPFYFYYGLFSLAFLLREWILPSLVLGVKNKWEIMSFKEFACT